MRLIEKLIIMLTALALIPLLLLSSLLYFNTRHTITKQALNQLQSVATLQENRLSLIHDQNLERLNTFSSRLLLRETLESYNRTKNPQDQAAIIGSITAAKAGVPDIDRISMADTSGQIVASTESRLINTQLGSDEAFQAGLTHANTDSLTKDPTYGLMFRMSGPLVLNNTVIGVVMMDTTAEALVHTAGDYTGLGQTGETVVAQKLPDGQGLFIAPLRFKPAAALTDKVNMDEPMTQALHNKELVFNNTTDYRQHQVFAVSRYVANSGWGVVVKIDRAEALEPVNRLRDILLVQGFVLCVAIVFFAILVARQLTDPILDIDEVAEQVSRGELKGRVAVTTQDELSNLASTFNAMLDGLQKLDKVKSEFVSLASHQLRTPASGVKARISLLLNGYAGKLTNKQRGHLKQAYDSNERQLRVINALLNIAIIESGHMKLEKKPTDLSVLLDDIVAELQDVIEARHQKLLVHKPKDSTKANVDADKVRMVIDNLVSNASKYTEDGGEIVVSLSRDDKRYITMSVTDNGVGIDPRDIPKLFQKFSQVDNHLQRSKDRGSSAGLGLYLAKHIVELHGGTIEVDSEPGVGSTFIIKLPIKS